MKDLRHVRTGRRRVTVLSRLPTSLKRENAMARAFLATQAGVAFPRSFNGRSRLRLSAAMVRSLSVFWKKSYKNIFSAMARSSPTVAAQEDFERAVCEYRNCLAANANNANACEGLRAISWMPARKPRGTLTVPMTNAAEEERERQEQNAKRERQLKEIPPQEIDESKWPKGVRSISIAERGGLGIDARGAPLLEWKAS
jgi:hypothetical protein